MHAVRDGAAVTLPALRKFCRDGRLSIEVIQSKDKDMANHCQRGLSWEVLSWQMAEEEPDAFEIIQAALNLKNSSGLMEHEMEQLNGLATVIVELGPEMEETLNWRLIQQRVMEKDNAKVADCSDFLMLCQMVSHALAQHAGGHSTQADPQSPNDGYNHWAEMKRWHEHIINPKTKRVRLATLAQLAHVPPGFPRLRTALFRLAYSGKQRTPEQIRNGLVFLKQLSDLTHMNEKEYHPVFRKAEDILHHWHVAYAEEGAYTHMKEKRTLNALWAQVEPRLVLYIVKKSKLGRSP